MLIVWFPFPLYIFSHLFTFSLCVPSLLKWFSCRQHITESYFFIHSTNLFNIFLLLQFLFCFGVFSFGGIFNWGIESVSIQGYHKWVNTYSNTVLTFCWLCRISFFPFCFSFYLCGLADFCIGSVWFSSFFSFLYLVYY